MPARRDRSSAPDTSVPFRPMYLHPARPQSTDSYFDPRGVAMYWRTKLTRNGTIVFDYPAWADASTGTLSLNGTIAGPTETCELTWQIAGRVVPFDVYYGIQTRNNTTGVVIAETYHTVSITGPGTYSISWAGSSNVNARLLLNGNQRQDNFPTD
jgi:hypothetical protein